MSNYPNYPLSLHHDPGSITRVWRNPNLFVTDDNSSDGGTALNPTYDPVDSSRLEAGKAYYYVANTEFDGSNNRPASNPQINYYWANPAGGIMPSELQPLSLAADHFDVQVLTKAQVTREIISKSGEIPNRGHFCLIAWIVGDAMDPTTVYPTTIPTKNDGTVDAANPLVAQRNIDVIDVPEGDSAMFQFSVPVGVNEIQIKRTPLAESRDLLEDSGMGNLTHEAEESPRMEIYPEGDPLPMDVFNAEALSRSPTLDLSMYPSTRFTVRAELPKVDQEDTGAIYSFETPNEQDGVAIVLAYKQSEEPEINDRSSEAWFERMEKLFGKKRADIARARWKQRKQWRQQGGRGRARGRGRGGRR